MKQVLFLTAMLMALSLTACTDIGDKVTFNVSLDGSVLHVCASFNLGPSDTGVVNQAMIDTFGGTRGVVNVNAERIWNARTVQDLVGVIREAKKSRDGP